METPAPKDSVILDMSGVSIGTLQDQERLTVEGVNWEVRAGQFWVVAGMHGSGKTDLLMVAGGVMPPQSGTYTLFGHPMPIFHDHLLSERLRLGLVFDSGQLLRQLTVKENIALPLRYHHNLYWQEVEERINEVMELTGLTPFANSVSGNLPRNLQKRTGLARALVLEPEILLVDTPLSGLDLRQCHWYIHFLENLARGKSFIKHPVTIIVTTEDLRPWRRTEAHFALLKEKQFVNLGYRPDLGHHAEPLVQELLAEELLR